jgi:hypothetical protein
MLINQKAGSPPEAIALQAGTRRALSTSPMASDGELGSIDVGVTDSGGWIGTKDCASGERHLCPGK